MTRYCFSRPIKKKPLRKTRIQRVCTLCHEIIPVGNLYAPFGRRGTGKIYCLDCEGNHPSTSGIVS
jgi:hypothetical protein